MGILFYLLTQIISLTFQCLFGLLGLVFRLIGVLVPWTLRRGFYVSNGLSLAILALRLKLQIEFLFAFAIGFVIAVVIDWGLTNTEVVYRQLIFGIVGFAAGLLLNVGIFPTLVLTGLAIWQAENFLS